MTFFVAKAKGEGGKEEGIASCSKASVQSNGTSYEVYSVKELPIL